MQHNFNIERIFFNVSLFHPCLIKHLLDRLEEEILTFLRSIFLLRQVPPQGLLNYWFLGILGIYKTAFYLAPCRVTQCGAGYIGNEFTNFAWYCTNTSINPICECKKGFIQDGNICVEGKLLFLWRLESRKSVGVFQAY